MELRSLPVVTRSNAMPRCPSEFVHPPPILEKTFYSISPFFSSASSSFPSDSSACWGEKEESHFSLPCVPRSPSFSQNFREVDNVSGFYLSDLFNSLTVLVFIIIIPRVILVRKRANFDGMLEKKGRERERNRLEKGSRCGWAYTCQRQQRFFEFSTRNTDRISRNTVGSSGKTSLSFHRSPPSSRQNEYVCYVQTAAREKAARGRATR